MFKFWTPLGALADAIRNRTDIHFGVYHSLFEFYNPLYLQDVANNLTTQDFVKVGVKKNKYFVCKCIFVISKSTFIKENVSLA